MCSHDFNCTYGDEVSIKGFAVLLADVYGSDEHFRWFSMLTPFNMDPTKLGYGKPSITVLPYAVVVHIQLSTSYSVN